MIHQPFINKTGGSTAIVNYLCNERIQQKTARVLRGNPELTKKIINSIGFKQKLAAGVLAFEEKDIENDAKTAIMKSFENILLPGMQGRYNILWVEHIDKNRLEFNYVIPKIDLISQKSLTPYFDKLDRHRIEIWRDNQNILHDLSDPNDPLKKQTINNDKRINLFSDYKKLDETLHQLVSSNIIRSRGHMIALLDENHIQTRIYKSFLYIKLPNSKKSIKLKGDIYNEQFRNIGAITEICNQRRDEVSTYLNRDTSRIFTENREKLDLYTQRKKEYLRKRFIKNRNSNEQTLSEEYAKYRRRYEKEITEKSNVEYDTNCTPYVCADNLSFNSNGKQGLNYAKLNERKNDDSNRAIISRIRRERESQQNTLHTVRKEGKILSKQLVENYKNIRRKHEQNKQGLPTSNFSFDSRVTESYEKCRNYFRERGAILEAIEGITKSITHLRDRNEFNKYAIEEIRTKLIKSNSKNVVKKIKINGKNQAHTDYFILNNEPKI